MAGVLRVAEPLSGVQRRQGGVEGAAGAHHLAGQLGIGAVVAADVRRFALHCGQFGDDGRFLLGQGLGQRGEACLEFGVFVLRGQGLGPVQRQVEVAATVVQLADLA